MPNIGEFKWRCPYLPDISKIGTRYFIVIVSRAKFMEEQ